MNRLLTRFRIGPRLGLGFAAVLVLTLLVGLFSINRLALVNDATTDLATNWMPAIRALGDYRAAIADARRAEQVYVIEQRPDAIAASQRNLDQARQAADTAWKAYAATITPGDEEKLAADIQSAQQRYYDGLAQLLALKHEEADFLEKARDISLNRSGAGFDALVQGLQRDVDFQSKGGAQAYDLAEASYGQTRMAVMALLAVAVAIGAALAWLITRSITAPIGRALTVAETVAAGDLTSRIDIDDGSRDETGLLLAALKRMNESLVRIVSEVRNGADSIATGSVQIANGNADLSQRTEEQASNLQQTAASMEQLTATVKQNSDTASQATRLAGDASQAAEDGGRAVGRVVATMNEISEASRRIAEIIGTIDGIAFQTNILALNAAVEAARAGEQGRGFAVVAGEVRTLAQRSAQAAKEIKALIGASVEKVEGGTRLVGQAGESMQALVGRVKRVNDLIAEISSASREQSTGISQIGDAVSQLDQVTQQNAALVEESAAAAESLKHQAATLSRAVSAFRL
ncbi:methyl-accepting chemotaxis protein [Pelomonas sp. KK5]|uniref:methyl-accepting chemotaxis protein n=1 Tax=Pelomonas sp. KK5 TaxID=1855730 RepID=UPI00097C2FC3|nr:methyl-accepting chemotaxis protein [Pelomonas sp. KK5]